MKINLQELRESLSEQHITDIVTKLGADRYEDKGNTLIFPTICHNPLDQDASMKLYYYKESHMFHCYTECSENFDIFDLIKRVKEVNRENYNFYETVCAIADLVSYNIFSETTQDKYISNIETLKENEETVSLSMINMTLEEKVRIWSLFNQPYRISAFYKVGPIFLESDKIKTVKRVQKVDISVHQK